jgi:acyl carrier protein
MTQPPNDDPEQILAWVAAQVRQPVARARATAAWGRWRPSADSLAVVELVLAVEEELTAPAGQP